MEGKIVIVAYKPKQGKEEVLNDLMRKHYSVLKEQDLVTNRKPVLMQAKDGTIIEVFEWKSEAAIKASHSNTEVLKMWEEYVAACEYIPLNKLEEAKDLFAEFAPFK